MSASHLLSAPDSDSLSLGVMSDSRSPSPPGSLSLSVDEAVPQWACRYRTYDPTVGRFLSLDTEEGDPEAPITLNRFIYTGDDPIDHTDPSGHDFSLAELSSVGGIQNTINVGVGYINTLVRIQSTVSKLIDLFNFSKTALRFLNALRASTPEGAAAALAAELRSQFGGVNTNQITSAFAEVARQLGPYWNVISRRIAARAGDIAADVAVAIAPRIPQYLQEEAAGTLQLVLYLPTGPAAGVRRGDRTINLSDQAAVAVSPTGGRLFGFGVRTSGQRRNPQNPGDQWFRIDYFDGRLNPPLNIHYHVFQEQDHHPGPERVIWAP